MATRLSRTVEKADQALGNGLEKSIRWHHRRRLRRLGWGGVFEPSAGLWAASEPPPRSGNAVEIMIDGDEVFAAMIAAVRDARKTVHIAGWHIDPDFRMSLDEPPIVLRDLLDEVADEIEVRVLLWAGAPLPPPFTPSRRKVRAAASRLRARNRIRVALDSKERALHCHHEKLLVVDDEVSFVGGMDFSRLGGDRLDCNDHPARGAVGWHDATSLLKGPVVKDVADHFNFRWREVTGEALPVPAIPPKAGDLEGQVVRTVPEQAYGGMPRGDFRILESYVRAFRSARKLVYLENQFLWSSEISKILSDKLKHPPCDEFRVLVVLPAKPATGKDDTLGQLAVLVDADGGAGRLLACTLYARHPTDPQPIYVHAKVGVVDDRWLSIGSGNLNNHSLFNDTEMNVVVVDEKLARDTRVRLWAEHLEKPIEAVEDDPTRVIDELWKPTADLQLQLRESGAPLTHRLVRLPHVSRRSKRLLGPLQTLLVDG